MWEASKVVCVYLWVKSFSISMYVTMTKGYLCWNTSPNDSRLMFVCFLLLADPGFNFTFMICQCVLWLESIDGPLIMWTCDLAATPVSKDLWDNSILKSETPVLVIFYANWCGPCRMVHRIIDEIATEYAGKLKCFIVNTDTDMEIAEDYDIKAVPVVLMFKNGQKCDSVIGTMPKEFYVAAIERVLKS